MTVRENIEIAAYQDYGLRLAMTGRENIEIAAAKVKIGNYAY